MKIKEVKHKPKKEKVIDGNRCMDCAKYEDGCGFPHCVANIGWGNLKAFPYTNTKCHEFDEPWVKQ